jgi:acyl carrier protein
MRCGAPFGYPGRSRVAVARPQCVLLETAGGAFCGGIARKGFLRDVDGYFYYNASITGGEMQAMDVAFTLQQFIEKNFQRKKNVNPITPDSSLLDSGVIDSVGIFELVGFIEESLGVKIEDEEIVPENFQTINNLVAFITSKRRAS